MASNPRTVAENSSGPTETWHFCLVPCNWVSWQVRLSITLQISFWVCGQIDAHSMTKPAVRSELLEQFPETDSNLQLLCFCRWSL